MIREAVLVLLLVTAIALAGCGTGPGPQHVSTVKVDTPRDEVENVFGSPVESYPIASAQISIYGYRTKIGPGRFGSGVPMGGAALGFFLIRLVDAMAREMERDTIYLLVAYSNVDQVMVYLASEEEKLEENKQLISRAMTGDPESEYRLSDEKKYRERVRWVCLAAHHGHGQAQYQMGRYSSLGILGEELDVASAYLWYTLAERNKTIPCQMSGEELTKAHHELAALMTPQDVVKAEHLLETWQPDPGSCWLQ